MNIGQPDLPTPQKALDSLKRIDRKTLEYSPSQGYKSLRKALVGYYERYQIKLKPDEIIITAGAVIRAVTTTIEGPEKYSRDVYDEYVERRKCLIDGVNRIPGCYTEFTPEGYEAETVMMAPAAGFYSNPVLGKNQVRLAYVLRKEELQRALIILEKAIETYNSVE